MIETMHATFGNVEPGKRGTVAMVPKERLHQLIDQLPEEECHAAERFLAYLKEHGDPLLRGLMQAPSDDEPETEGERQAVEDDVRKLSR